MVTIDECQQMMLVLNSGHKQTRFIVPCSVIKHNGEALVQQLWFWKYTNQMNHIHHSAASGNN